jgi:phage FluMu protein Com
MDTTNLNSYQSLPCTKCGRIVDNVGETAVKVTCSYCVLFAVGIPEEKKSYTPTGRPPGWHFMSEFVDKDGNVFHKGKEIKKLKGTLPPTKVVSKPKKKIKRRTKEQILIDRHNEKKAALKKAVKKQKDFLNHNIDKG